MRILVSEACMAEGADWLAAREPAFARARAAVGVPPLRRTEPGFGALLRAIVSQQVSTAAARAIWARLEGAGLTDPAAIRAAADDDLRAAGLSRQKLRSVRALAGSGIDFAALATAPEDEIVARLTAVPGIGRWTAEIYAMFSLGRADVFAPADLALQEGARMLFDLPARPGERVLRAMAAAWSPWRSVAAGWLWAYYADVKRRDGVM
jgi:DNA-3-methyladenine glycosylase II